MYKYDEITGKCECGFESNEFKHQPKDPRPTYQQIYMRLAFTLAERSTCSRRHVGAVITTEDYRRVLSVGYNGNASGLANSCDDPDISGACGCLHAEENAIISCYEPPSTPKIIFTTTYPCKMCAKRLIQLGGIKIVYYGAEYRNTEAESILHAVGIKQFKITEA